MDMPQSVDALMTPNQTCAALGMKRTQLYAMLARGDFPAADLRVNGRPRWLVSTFNGWVEARRGQCVSSGKRSAKEGR